MGAGLDRARLELFLPAEDPSIGAARAAVDRLEPLQDHPDTRFAIRLLVSELFTNAVKYGTRRDGARVRLTIEIADRHVRVEVGDQGAGFERSDAPMPDEQAESGRGLAFLDALASRWGVIRDAREGFVWFELEY